MTIVTAEAHANIALVKYWGKHSVKYNIPATPSLSITLDALTTRTRIETDVSQSQDTILLNGKLLNAPKVNLCVAHLRKLSKNTFPFVKITSENNFPTAAGLASSASGYAALVTALNALGSLNLSTRQLSVFARMASGSAARSVFGGFTCLRSSHPESDNQNDQESEYWYASQILDAQEWPMQAVIAICTEQTKSTSSSSGMQLSRNTSPYYESWVSSTKQDFDHCLQAVRDRDFERVATISEHSCLKMHGLMLSTNPGLVYWNAATIECIHALRALRNSGVAVFFTIDAGPQVKAICLPEAVESVNKVLSAVHGVHRTLISNLGSAAHIVNSDPADQHDR